MLTKNVLKAGEQVRILRERLGLTVPELAEKSGLSRVYLHALEGGGDVRLTTLQRVCGALGVSMGELCSTEEET